MKKIFADENINCIKESLENRCDLTIYSGRKLTNQDLIESNCEFLLTRSQTKVNMELLKNTIVKFVATATSGTDHFDLNYLKNEHIQFADAKGSNANSVAEYVIFGILHWLNSNNYDPKKQTIGIVGYGCIGKLVAKYSNLLGLNVLVNDPPLKENGCEFPEFANYLELDDLIQNSTIITNHVPYEPFGKYPTKYLFNEKSIELIRDNSLFIHASRGGVVQEFSLIEAIEQRNITAIIDVWENEPDFDMKLAEIAMIATPHVAGYSLDGKLRGTEMVLDALEKISNVIPDRNLLNYELQKYSPLPIDQYTDWTNIYKSLSLSRKIIEDSENLKNIISVGLNTEKKSMFDLLRKNYPLRREIL